MTDKQQQLAAFLDQTTIAGGADFHLHSNYSDGLLGPVDVLRAAWKARLRAMAITDHDSLGGIAEAEAEHKLLLTENKGPDVTVFVAGIEISTYFADSEIHLLAYFPEKPPAEMYKFIAEIQKERKIRNQRMFEQILKLGYELSISGPEEGDKEDEVWGRVHLARQLVKDGYFKSGKEAFKKLLLPGKPGYIARRHFTVQECLRHIDAANGIAVLAHPHEYKFCPPSVDDEEAVQLLTDIFRDLKAMGLHGIEAFHGMVDPEQAYLFYKLARELDLIVTQGSDNHGKDVNGSHHVMYTRETELYREYVLSRDKSAD
ncbi:MAG: PHP domain-containing protein [Clostridiaceae bacterium]|jgi:predicted metal-dependent phosphoesterase TrpH|nr:PHP domain-containing protein [Clostridiaceae bacterium]